MKTKFSHFPTASASLIFLFLLAGSYLMGADTAADQASWDEKHPKQIFAHYMGCFPLGIATTTPVYLRKVQAAIRPDGPSYLDGVGGRYRDVPLMPADYKPTYEEVADVEMRRAMRMGLDGFAFVVLSGQQTALDTMDAMFKVAEAKHYPFQITFCLANPAKDATAVKYLLEKHGNSPNLPRRNGKPMLMAYRSNSMQESLRPDLKGTDRVSPAGIEVYNQAAQDLETAVGQPLYLSFCLNGFVPGEDTPDTGLSADPAFWKSAATILSKRFGGLSAFFWGGTNYNLAAKAAREAGLDWGEPIWFQYQNLYWGTMRLSDGTDLLRDRWDHAIANKATLIQAATWNDYAETTGFMPSTETGYAINDLTSLYIQKWKTGKMPEPKTDRIYLFYPPYPKGALVYPFHETAPEQTQQLEVTTFLTAPATVTVPGRDMSWEAPAGLFVKKLPPTPGPVIAELWREGKMVLSFAGREPITDHPFRPDHTLVAACTEDERYWAEDFPNSGSFPAGYYADDDHDGLPNWFEMFWFGKLGDFTTATVAKPGDDPAGDGSTSLQKFLSRSNPLRATKPLAVGANWNLLKNPLGNSFNPETDAQYQPQWRYLSGDGADHWKAYPWQRYSEKSQGVGVVITHSHETMNTLNPPPPLDLTSISYRWDKADGTADGLTRRVVLSPLPSKPVKVEWTCPGDGTYRVNLAANLAATAKSSSADRLKLVTSSPDSVWTSTLQSNHPTENASVDVHLKKGEILSLQADLPDAHVGQVELTGFEITLTAMP